MTDHTDTDVCDGSGWHLSDYWSHEMDECPGCSACLPPLVAWPGVRALVWDALLSGVHEAWRLIRRASWLITSRGAR